MSFPDVPMTNFDRLAITKAIEARDPILAAPVIAQSKFTDQQRTVLIDFVRNAVRESI